MAEKIELFFNEKEHAYTDNRGFKYTSMTTVIGKYEVKFDIDGTARACSKAKGSQYYGMSVSRIKQIWKEENAKSLVKGNRIHNYLEDAIKKASGYTLIEDSYINDKIYTVYDLDDITDKQVGELDLQFFIDSGLSEKYPRIFKLITMYVNSGYRIFSEIGIFDPDRLISGLIDILLLNPNTKEFFILDWKTNKHQLIPFGKEHYKWVSGYFKKSKFGQETHKFVETNTFFKFPLNKYQQSHFMIYSLQLSGYANLVEKLGFKCNGIILCHVREELSYQEGCAEVERTPEALGKAVTDLHTMPYLKDDVNGMFNHHFDYFTNANSQLFIND